MTTWKKSSFSDNNGCFELADLGPGVVGLRDSKLGDGSPVLRLTRSQVAGLIAGIKAGDYDDLA